MTSLALTLSPDEARRIDHASAALDRLPPIGARVKLAIDTLEPTLGSRDEIVQSLACLHENGPTAELLFHLTRDPSLSVADACIRCVPIVTVATLLAAYKRGRKLLVQVVKVKEATDPLLIRDVVKDVMARAVPYTRPCPACGGVPRPALSPHVPAPPQCKVCNGTLVETVAPDLDRQKYALELAEVGPPPPGSVTVNNQIDNRKLTLGAASPDALVKLLRATDKILYGQAQLDAHDPTDLAPVDAEEPTEPPDAL